MRFFKRRKHRETTGMPEMHPVKLSSVFGGFDITPLPLEHTYKFIMDGIDPLSVERERLKGKSVDWLIADKRDAAIEADSKEEIAHAKKHFTNQTYCISPIIAGYKGEVQVASEQKNLVQEEIALYNRIDEELKRRESLT